MNKDISITYMSGPHDGKTQVTLKDGVIQSVVASFQNAPHDDLAAQGLEFQAH